MGFPGELPAKFLGELPAGFLDELPAGFSIMSRNYVSGRGSRDVWTSDAALVGGGSETSGLATQIVWGVGAETFAFDAALEGGGTETDCTSDAAYASCLFMLELNFHSGSSITQVSVMSRNYVSGRGSRDVWTSDAALVGGGSETSGLATQILWGVGAETFAFDATLEGGGTETDCTSDAAYASCLFMLELNFHSGSSIYSSQWFACLASHTSRSNSPVTHPSFFPLQREELDEIQRMRNTHDYFSINLRGDMNVCIAGDPNFAQSQFLRQRVWPECQMNRGFQSRGMSRDYVRGWGSRDVWTSDAALVGGGSETSGLATQIVWGVGAETFAFNAALEGGGTETDCTSDAAYVYIYPYEEMRGHPIPHGVTPLLLTPPIPSPLRDVWTSDAALVGGGSETSGLATQIVWGVGAETFAFDAALEGGGTETDCTSDAAYASCLFMLELNFHSGSSITQMRLTSRSDCYRAGALGVLFLLTDCSGVYQFRKPCSEIVRMWMCDVVATTHFKPSLHEFLYWRLRCMRFFDSVDHFRDVSVRTADIETLEAICIDCGVPVMLGGPIGSETR
ncbi:hypothetical protein F2Q68_00004651 [Brassica cretica]|uniref:Uncharacterized protein n=1 Tax=Brassica cretica TaxID=69181 RepID=A0A8S9JMQ9_BRACR|nr:hypothetical protein F2Q68_00004651 [Brassica cretica]